MSAQLSRSCNGATAPFRPAASHSPGASRVFISTGSSTTARRSTASSGSISPAAGPQWTGPCSARPFARPRARKSPRSIRWSTARLSSAPMREGSRRAGAPFSICRRALAENCRSTIALSFRRTSALGHLTVVQAIAYREAGISLPAAELLSGWTLVNGLVSAATRLGVIAHVEAQRGLSTARKTLAGILAEPSPSDALPSSFTPLIDIAVSRMRDLVPAGCSPPKARFP